MAWDELFIDFHLDSRLVLCLDFMEKDSYTFGRHNKFFVKNTFGRIS